MFVTVGVLEYDNEGILHLTAKGKKLQTSEYGLTEDQLKEELQEENEERNRLGKPPVSFEEWNKKHQKRIKPLKQE
jgi:hypothetical protein